MPEQKQSYDVKSPICHNGKLYRSDDADANVIKLTDTEAELLIDCGAILKEPRADDAGEGDEAAVPTDPAERITAIKGAIESLDKENPELWLKDKITPDVKAVEDVLGFSINATERNQAVSK